jgi:methionyl-tRNA formyltransferase
VSGGPARDRAAAGEDRPARTVFFGSGAFGVPILDAVIAAPETDVIAVVSAPDRPAGRRGALTAVPVAERARELGLWLLQPERLRSTAAIAEIAALAPTLGVLADYGQIVPASLVDLPDRGILNVHPSLLPRHRGASPIPATILAGDTETGVTLIRMDAGLDTGPIVDTSRWSLSGDETAPELEARAAAAGAELLSRVLGPWLRGEIAATPQPTEGVTMTRPLRREDGRLDPDRPAVELARQVRAYDPWPGTFVELPTGRLRVLRAEAIPSAAGDRPRTMTADDEDGIAVATVDGRLRLLEVQPAGRTRMSGADYLRGVREISPWQALLGRRP